MLVLLDWRFSGVVLGLQYFLCQYAAQVGTYLPHALVMIFTSLLLNFRIVFSKRPTK